MHYHPSLTPPRNLVLSDVIILTTPSPTVLVSQLGPQGAKHKPAVVKGVEKAALGAVDRSFELNQKRSKFSQRGSLPFP
jgi:hypothetical protein